MNKCIQINIGGKVFKFDDVKLSDSGGKNLPPTIRNIIDMISRDPKHLELLEEFLEYLNSENINSITPDYNNTTEYADNIVGDLSPLDLSATYSALQEDNTAIKKLASLLKDNNLPIIKLREKGDKVSIVLGNSRSLVLATLELLGSNEMIKAMSYLWLDHKSADSYSPVYKELLMIYSKLLELSGIQEVEPLVSIVAELDLLDAVNANKRLLAYIFSTRNDLSGLPLFEASRESLQKLVSSTIESTSIFSPNTSIAALYKYIPLKSDAEVIEFAKDTKMTLKLLRDLIYEYNHIDRTLTMSLVHVILALENLNNPLWGEYITTHPYKLDEASNYIRNYVEYALSLASEGTYDSASLLTLSPSQLLFVLHNISYFTELLKLENKVEKFNLDKYLVNVAANNVQLTDIDTKNLVGLLDIKVGNDLNVAPIRKIEFNYDKTSNPSSGAITIKINEKILKPYTLSKKVLTINPNKEIVIDPIDFGKFSAIYISPEVLKNYRLMSWLLTELKLKTNIRFFRTDGKGFESVRLALDAINSGYNVTVYPKEDFTWDEGVEGDKVGFTERFSHITTIPPSLLNPTVKFYTGNSGYGYDFSNKQGYVNLSPALSKLEEETPTLVLDLFDLLKRGIINSIVINNSRFDILGYKNGDVIDFYSEYDKDRHAKFSLDKRTVLSGDLYLEKAPKYDIGTLWSTIDSKILIVGRLPNGDVIIVDMNKYPDSFSTYTISTDQLSEYNSYIGSYPVRNGLVNVLNTHLFLVNDTRFALVGGVYLLLEFYSEDFDRISEETGYSKAYLLRNFYASTPVFKTRTIINITPVQDAGDLVVHDKVPNFNGKVFALRLAAKLNTTIHFVTKALILGMGFKEAPGFIYNGEVYINSDNLNNSTPFHELTHLVLAYMKEHNYDKYLELLNSMDPNDPLIAEVAKLYPELTNSDRMEEALAEKVGQSFSSLFVDEDLDNKLRKMDFSLALDTLLGIESDGVSLDFRTVMTSGIKALSAQSKLDREDFGDIFKTGHPLRQGLLTSIKSRLLKSEDMKNKLFEKCDG